MRSPRRVRSLFSAAALPFALLAPAAAPLQAAALISKMEAAYAQIEGYRTETTVETYRRGRLAETQRFLYTFHKPNHLRIELRSPRRGTVLVYPDATGKVSVKLGGWLGLVRLRLSPDSRTLRSPAGQRIDQTGLGLLIQNISHSLTDRRRGEATISEDDAKVVVEVLADDHFLTGVVTRYQFTIDAAQWLPVAVEESTPERTPKRRVTFADLDTSVTAATRPLTAISTSGGHAAER